MDKTVPALERAIRILETVETSAEGVSAAQLLTLGIPRTTLYRILRILADAQLLAERPGDGVTWMLGPAIARMARGMPTTDDLAVRAQPVLERLSAQLGESVKLVVRDGLETVAVAVHQPSEDSRIASRLGARLPLHVGAGQRLLLSHAPPDVLERLLSRPLEKRNVDTIVDPVALRRNVATLRKQEWALGRHEGAPGVGSIAALVHEAGREPRAALVSLYILSGRQRDRILEMRDAVIAAARTLHTVPR
jgi:DNA-binding IclR family transcriptional regulator